MNEERKNIFMEKIRRFKLILQTIAKRMELARKQAKVISDKMEKSSEHIKNVLDRIEKDLEEKL